MEKIHKNDFGEAHFDEAKQFIHQKYQGVVNYDLAIEVHDEVINYSQSKQLEGMINDLTEMKGTFTNLNDYLSTKFIPSLVKRGLMKVALIMPEDVFTQFAATQLSQKLGDFELQMFDTWDKGYSWLESKV